MHKSGCMFIKSFLIGVMALILIGCKKDAETPREKLHVVTTFTVIADMASNVAGDAATVVSVTKPGAEIHNYQPTPQDIVRTDKARLLLWNGLGLELWFEKFLAELSDVPSTLVTSGITPIDINNGPYTGKPNPHAWMSPSDALIYVDNIAKAMSEVDPDNADIYKRNADNYKSKISELTQPLKEQLQTIPESERWLVTSEGAFSYLARDLQLQELYLWPINADQQGTPQQVKNVIDTVNQNKIRAVFSESTVSPKPAQQVARETGAHYGGTLYVDSLSQADGPVPTYLDLIRVTTETVVTGLSVKREQ